MVMMFNAQSKPNIYNDKNIFKCLMVDSFLGYSLVDVDLRAYNISS